MQKEPTTVEKLRGLRWSIALNSANTVFVQFTYFGSAFVLFLDRLGLSKADIGFILALVPFSNLLAIWIAPVAARYGYKRTFIIFFGLRKLVTFFLLLTPWVVMQFGAGAAFAFVAGVVGLFAAFRTVEETAFYPWYQEFVPNVVRGKYTANSTTATALVGVISVAVAGWVIDTFTGLSGFMALITAGVLFGLLSTWCGLFIPGGAPITHDAAEPKPQRDLRGALRDPDFVRYLIGLALITLGTVPVASFLPLFLEEQIGLSSGGAVFVQMGSLLGTISSSFLWGWAADRYGGRPVMITGVISFVITPFFWWLMPRNMDISLYVALGIAFLQGLANLGWGIGATRLLFGSVVPKEKNMDYLAIWFAWAGITAGISQLIGGWVLEAADGLQGDYLFFVLDSYAPLFILAIVAPLLSIFLLAAIRGDSAVSMGQFAGLFLRGNPFMAMTSLVKFYSARDEYSTVRTTERLGQARSTLAVNELLEALADPRFNVRFEAIQATARMKPDAQLTAGLVKILLGKNPALSVMAAWALGRIGDRNAANALWQGLNSPFKSVRMHCVRSLGTLGDRRSGKMLLNRLESETDEGLQLAYASALGGLRVSKASFKLLELLYSSQDEEAQLELALALARIVGDESFFIQLWRNTRGEAGTALAQTVELLKKKWLRWNKPGADDGEATALLTACAAAFAANDIAGGTAQLQAFLESAPLDACEYINMLICQECAVHLAEYGETRQEYLFLALHSLHECFGRVG